jgi:hypothetical protein
MTFSFIGVAALLGKAMNAVDDGTRAAADEFAADVQAPVLTGALDAGIEVISVERSGTSVIATVSTTGASNEYAAYVEEGTSKMAAEPYMAPALINSTGPLHDAIARAASSEF